MLEFEKEFHALLKEFHQNGALNYLVLIGSWCLLIYKEHYPIPRFAFNTSDVDFSIERPRDMQKNLDISLNESLRKLGYVPKSGILTNAERYIPAPFATANSLSIEFLCEPGRHITEPYRIPNLDIVTTPLSYQKVLLEHSMKLNYKRTPVKVPRPAIWAIHKIAISQLRTGKSSNLKMIKDMENALIVIRWLGYEAVQKEAMNFKGKFRALFQKGFQQLQDKYVF